MSDTTSPSAPPVAPAPPAADGAPRDPFERATYENILSRVRALAPGETIAVPRDALTPRPPTWRRSIGQPKPGASLLRQWRDGLIHVHVTPTHYLLHRDTVDPHRELWRHIATDSPGVARVLRRAGVAIGAGLVLAAGAGAARVARGASLARRRGWRSRLADAIPF